MAGDDPQRLRARADEVLELHEAGELESALDACHELLDEVSAAPISDPVVRETLFAARMERALLLTELDDLPAAAAAYGEAATTPADLDDPDQRHEVAMALLDQGVCLDAIGDPAAALGAYDELVVRFGDAEDPVTRDQVVKGRVNRAAALLALERGEQALTVADALTGELDPRDALEAEQLVMALRLRASTLGVLGRDREVPEALARLDAVDADDPAVHVQLIAAQRERVQALVAADDRDRAAAVLEATLARYEGHPDPAIAEVVTDLRAAGRHLGGGHGSLAQDSVDDEDSPAKTRGRW